MSEMEFLTGPERPILTQATGYSPEDPIGPEHSGVVRPYRTVLMTPADKRRAAAHRIMVATPSRGYVRIEWHLARMGQVVPMNWSAVTMNQPLDGYYTVGLQLADAQNAIVKEAVERDFEWLLLIEDDTVPPMDAFMRINRHMMSEENPVVSGLYYSKTDPPEPLVFRGRGTGCYKDWKLGDQVWCDGVPTGFLLVHCSILREMYKDAPEYNYRGLIQRRVFQGPRSAFYDPEDQAVSTTSGTTDLDWCERVMTGGYLGRAGWKRHQGMSFPFLVDTNILCIHIDETGQQYP